MTFFGLSIFFVFPRSFLMSFFRFGRTWICGQTAAPRHFTSPTHMQTTTHSSPSHPMTLQPPSHPTTPYLLIPAPTFRTLSGHPTITLNDTPSIQRARIFFPSVFPKFYSQSTLTRVTPTWWYRVWIPDLGVLRIIAFVSLTHIPSLFACLHESVSCVYVFFSIYLSICILRAACLVFCSIFILPFSISKYTSIWLSLYT